MSENAKLYPAYFKDVSHLDSVDVYRIIDLWALHHPALQHALKKVLVCGRRGPKDASKDAQEAIDALKRFIEMMQEDAKQAGSWLNEALADSINTGTGAVEVKLQAESFKVDGVELASQGKAVELERIPVNAIEPGGGRRYQLFHFQD